jgi:CBS domain-containing membrane protein
MKVRDLMTEDPFTLNAADGVLEAIRLMERERIRHVPILSLDGDLLGLISHRDVVRGTLDLDDLPLSMQRDLRERQAISDFMVHDVETVSPEDSLFDAASLMLENKYGCVPVVDGTDLVGILTESDFVRHVAENLS